MNITPQRKDGATVLDLSGRFEFSSRKMFMNALQKAQEGSPTQVINNLEGVPFLDSAALGLLALAQQNLKVQNIHLSLLNPQEYVKKVLELANFQKFIPIASSIAEAKSAVLV
ncbi:MAG: STAS domain-containing protein [Nitrospirota bacterium]|nr:STAS domain-containing protein [Nitrospirota bacterium]